MECFGHLDFWQDLANLYPGPWEWLLPEAQASKGRQLPLRGALDQGAELEPATLPQNCDLIKRRDCLQGGTAVSIPRMSTSWGEPNRVSRGGSFLASA